LFLEIKNEYTDHLIDTLTPFIYEGLSSLYKEADRIASESGVANNKTLMIFQKLLQGIDKWNQAEIEKETNRIKQLSGTSEYLDDLIKAVIKSNIILLTYSNTISNVIAQSYYNTMSTYNLVHRCYIECAKDAHNNPFLFFHDVTPMDFKRNQIIVQQNIQSAITRAIRKMLPISLILKEYLVNSINIINEPPKVELIGAPLPQPSAPIKAVSEKNIDPKVENEITKIIKSENIKTDKQKIQAIMGIDKLITSMEGGHDVIPSKIKKPYESESESSNIANRGLDKNDKKLINININPTPVKNIPNNVSETTMSGHVHKIARISAETSERIDPSQLDYIEEYGTETHDDRIKHGRKSR